MRVVSTAKGALLALCLTGSGWLAAGELALFHGQGADVNLPDIIPKLLQGEIDMDPTWFWGLNYSREIDLQGLNPVSRFLLEHRVNLSRLATDFLGSIRYHASCWNTGSPPSGRCN